MDTRETAQRYIPVKVIADHFGVSVSTIYRQIDAGKLEAIRIGRTVRVPEAAFARMKRTGLQSS